MGRGKPGLDFVGVGVGVAVRNQEGKFLLGQCQQAANNEPGKWCFPGGTLGFGEKIFDCAAREAREGAGIGVEPVRLLRVIDHVIGGERQHWVNPIVEARLVKGKPVVREPHKMAKWQWFSLEELPENLAINMAQFFGEVKRGRIALE